MKKLLTCVLLLAALAAHAQTVVDGMTVPATHPIIWLSNSTRVNAARTWFCQGAAAPCTGATKFTPPVGTADYGSEALYDLLNTTTTYTATTANWFLGFTLSFPTKPSGSCDPCRFQGEKIAQIFDWDCAMNCTAAQKGQYIAKATSWVSAWDSVTWGGRKIPNYPGSTAGSTASPLGNYFWGYWRNDFEIGLAFLNETNIAWASTHAYPAYSFVTDSNNNLEYTVAGGTSAGSVPTWPTGTWVPTTSNGFPVTSVDGAGTYTLSTTLTNPSQYVGYAFNILGFANAANNLQWAVCTGATATTLTFAATTVIETPAAKGNATGFPTVTDGSVTWVEVGESPKRMLDVATNASDGRWTNWFVPMTQAASQPVLPAAGGITSEGDEYGRTNTYYPVLPLVTANLLGRDMLAEAHGFFRQLAFYLIYATSPGPVTKVAGQPPGAGGPIGQAYYEGFSFNDSSTFGWGGSIACSTNCQVHSTTYTKSQANGLGNYFGDYMNMLANYLTTTDHTARYVKTWMSMTNDPLPYHLQIFDNSSAITGLPLSNLALTNYMSANQFLYGRDSWNTTNVSSYFFEMGQRGFSAYNGLPVADHVHDSVGNFDIVLCGATGECHWGTRNTASYAEKFVGYGISTGNNAFNVWAPATSFNLNQWIIPITRNGYSYQEVATPGPCTSGGTEPVWPTVPKRTILDGSCIWMNTSNTRDSQFAQANATAIHNTLLIDGQGMAVGGSNGAPSQSVIVQRLESNNTAGYDYADADLTQIYRNNCAANNPVSGQHGAPCVVDGVTDTYSPNISSHQQDNIAVAHAEREFISIRNPQVKIILDRVKTNPVVILGAPADPTTADCSTTSYAGGTCVLPAANVTTSFQIHCEQSWTTDTGVAGDTKPHEICTNGNERLRTTTLLPTAITVRPNITEWSCASILYGTVKGCDDTGYINQHVDGQYRLEIESNAPCQYQYQLNVLQEMNTTDPNIVATVVDSNPGCANALTGTFTVTLTPAVGSATVVVFNKGEFAVGGTINVAGAGAVNLATAQALVTYTNDGPVWSAAGAQTPLVSVTIAPVNPSTDSSTPVQLSATALYTDNSRVDVTSLATWSESSGGTVAAINSTGLATPIANGSTTITASYTNGVTKTDTTVLTVGAPPGGGGTGPGATSVTGNVQIKGNVHVTAQ